MLRLTLRVCPVYNRALLNYRYISNFRKVFNMDKNNINKAVVVHEEDWESVDISFRFVSEARRLDRVFNFQRHKNDSLSKVLEKISLSITNRQSIKKRRKKGSYGGAAANEEVTPLPVQVDMVRVTESDDAADLESLSDDNIKCYDAFVTNVDKYNLIIDNERYCLDLNPPLVVSLDIPKCIMSGFPVTVTKFKTSFADMDHCLFRWFKSDLKFKDKNEAHRKLLGIKWLPLSQNCYAITTDEDIGCLLKVIVTPCLGHRKGQEVEALSSVLVSAGPDVCPFERRHEHTRLPAGERSLRVISYNILADMYADSEHARSNIFPTCPAYAMDIYYRKQLLMKELMGYNADLICLQEVDEKVFKHDLEPALRDFEGHYGAKAGLVKEGVAIFLRKNKLRLLENSRFVLSEELESNVLFADMWEKLQQNEVLKERVSKRTTILQASVLESVEDPSKLVVVGVTHLYFHPNADHIRLLQGGICMQLLSQIVSLYQNKHPDKDVSLLFCGDFNSTPEFGIYRFMTTQFIDTEDVDWTSCSGEMIKGIEICHDFQMESACGLPSYTNYTVGFYGCLDYIFYQANKFTVKKVIPMPTHEEVTKHIALPSVVFPSDHIPLIADLEFKPK